MRRAIVDAGALGRLLGMTRSALRLEVTSGQTSVQKVIAPPPPPALRARQTSSCRCTPVGGAFSRSTLSNSGSAIPRHRQGFSSSSIRRSKQGKPTQGDDVVSPALLSRLQARLEEWHLASSSHTPYNSSAAEVSAEERQEHLDLARMELKWMMDELSASTSTGQNQNERGKDDSGEERTLGARLEEMVRRRVEEHEPLAYILGTQPFGSLDLLVRPPTLIPRPETEDWTSRLIGQIHSTLPADSACQRPLRVLDLCTGTGCIGLSLAAALGHQAQVTCGDVAEETLQLVRENLARNGLLERTALDETGAGVRLAQVDLFSPRAQLAQALFLEQKDASSSEDAQSGSRYDSLVCNPPYIPRAEYDALQPSVRLWEDRRALLGEYEGSSERGEVGEQDKGQERDQGREEGLAFYRRLADVLDLLLVMPAAPAQARQRHSKDEPTARLPVLALEVGKGQAAAVEDIFRASVSGQRMDFEKWEDPWGVERVVVGYWRSQ